MHALDKLKEQGVGLVIAVDCGVRAHREAQHAHSLGLDLILIDHHELEADSLPDAFAVIDPKIAPTSLRTWPAWGWPFGWRSACCARRAQPAYPSTA